MEEQHQTHSRPDARTTVAMLLDLATRRRLA